MEQLDLFKGKIDMATAKIPQLSRRMGASASEHRTGDLSPAELVTIVRRLGYVALRVHEVVMGRLTSQEEYSMAESFNDLFKPLCDLLVHFELEAKKEVSDEVP